MDNTTTATTDHHQDPVPDPEEALEIDATTSSADIGSVAKAPHRARRWHRIRPWGSSSRVAIACLTLLSAASLVLAVVFGWKLEDRSDVDAASRQAVVAARQYAVTLTSIDADHIDQDLAAVTAGATGTFKDNYTQSAAQLKPLLVQAKSVSKGQVIDACAESATTHEVVVMLFVDSAITNTTNPTPRVDRNRVIMTMDNIGGHWLAGKVDLP